MRFSFNLGLVGFGLVAGYVTGTQALNHVGLAPAADGSRWQLESPRPKDPSAIYALGRFRVDGLVPPPRNVMLFWRKTDDDGNPLRSSCNYVLAGPEPGARWWSVAAYPEGDPAGASFTAGDATLTGDGRLELSLSRHAVGGNLLLLGDYGNMALRLALSEPYETTKAGKYSLPGVKKVDCQ